MAFKAPNWLEEKRREWDGLKYIKVDEAEIHVSEFKDRSITPEIYGRMRMNSYARDYLPPKLTDQTLIEMTEFYLSNCNQVGCPCATYDEAVINLLMPEFIARLKELNE